MRSLRPSTRAPRTRLHASPHPTASCSPSLRTCRMIRGTEIIGTKGASHEVADAALGSTIGALMLPRRHACSDGWRRRYLGRHQTPSIAYMLAAERREAWSALVRPAQAESVFRAAT